MVCERFDLVCRHLDGDLDRDEQAVVTRHLAGCKECQAAMLGIRERESGVRQVVDEVLAGRSVVERVMQRVASEPAPKRRREAAPATGSVTRWRFAFGLLLAAVLAGAGMTLFFQWLQGSPIDRGVGQFAIVAAGPNAEVGGEPLAVGSQRSVSLAMPTAIRGPVALGLPAGNRITLTGKATLAAFNGGIDWLGGDATLEFTLLRPVSVRIGAARLDITGTVVALAGNPPERVRVELVRGSARLVAPNVDRVLTPGAPVTLVGCAWFEADPSAASAHAVGTDPAAVSASMAIGGDAGHAVAIPEPTGAGAGSSGGEIAGAGARDPAGTAAAGNVAAGGSGAASGPGTAALTDPVTGAVGGAAMGTGVGATGSDATVASDSGDELSTATGTAVTGGGEPPPDGHPFDGPITTPLSGGGS